MHVAPHDVFAPAAASLTRCQCLCVATEGGGRRCPHTGRHVCARAAAAFDLALGGSNVFLTGGPGTGKSFTLRKIIDGLEEKNGSGSVLVWAPTGVAAILVGGQTINSKPGPGIPEGSSGFENMWAHKKYWREVKTLVIDEISMVDAEFLDWIDAYVRRNVPQ